MHPRHEDRLRAAIKRFGAHTAPGRTRPPSESRDWQQFIEAELDQMNRRLTQIETRMTIVFYLVVILTVVTVIKDADAAQLLLKSVLQLK